MRTCFSILKFVLIVAFLNGCSKDELPGYPPVIILKPGSQYTYDGSYVPLGGKLTFGLSVSGSGFAVTNLRVKRILEESTITEIDQGMFISTGGLDTTLIFNKGKALSERWSFFVMNANRDTASLSVTVNLGSGSAYGDIISYPSVILGYQQNTFHPNFLDLYTGITYDHNSVQGHEEAIDLAAFWYITSGKSSPTLTCPAYPSALTYYPEFKNWNTKNTTSYDYYTSDNGLISAELFDNAKNDSLLVAGYRPQNISGLCKYSNPGRIIPFKTSSGKYGLIKVIRADESQNGSMEISIKIQK